MFEFLSLLFSHFVLITGAVERIGQFNTYSHSRGKLFVKYFRFPGIEDYQIAIRELEQRQLEFDVHTFSSLADQYLALHDQVVKNYDKLKKPVKARQYAPDTI